MEKKLKNAWAIIEKERTMRQVKTEEEKEKVKRTDVKDFIINVNDPNSDSYSYTYSSSEEEVEYAKPKSSSASRKIVNKPFNPKKEDMKKGEAVVTEVLIDAKKETVGACIGDSITDTIASLEQKVYKGKATVEDVKDAGQKLQDVAAMMRDAAFQDA